jgi:cytidylate kinase
MPVITVSGSLASGARDIAQAVARELHLDYVDQEILVAAATELGVSVSAMESHDERTATLGERLGNLMRAIVERSAAAGAADPASGSLGLDVVLGRTYGEAAELPPATAGGQLDDERYIKTLKSVIHEIASRGDVVILGRGSQAILQGEPATMHVYVAAPREQRITYLMQRDSLDRAAAEHRIDKSDHQRQAFHRHYFKIDADSPALYDLGINAGRIRTDVAAGMIALAAAQLTPAPG